MCGIECDLDNSANYIGFWLTLLGQDKKFIIEAASKAQKAVDYILGENYNNYEDIH